MTRTEAIAKIEATRAEFADTVTKARAAARRIRAEADANPMMRTDLIAKANRLEAACKRALDDRAAKIATGQNIAEYHQAQRNEIAAKIAAHYRMPARVRDQYGMTAKAYTDLRDYMRTAAARLAYRAPARLANRRDLIKHARMLRAWARDTAARTDWHRLPCGEDDALSERLDAASQDAAALRAYARTLR